MKEFEIEEFYHFYNKTNKLKEKSRICYCDQLDSPL